MLLPPGMRRHCLCPRRSSSRSLDDGRARVDCGDRPGRHQRWTRTRVVSPVAGSGRTTILMLPPCSRSGSKTALQAHTGPPALAAAGGRQNGPGFSRQHPTETCVVRKSLKKARRGSDGDWWLLPHRSRRALLTHRAPTSGHDVEPPVGKGVPQLRAGQPRAMSDGLEVSRNVLANKMDARASQLRCSTRLARRTGGSRDSGTRGRSRTWPTPREAAGVVLTPQRGTPCNS
jgi:hypothetical protein